MWSIVAEFFNPYEQILTHNLNKKRHKKHWICKYKGKHFRKE